MRLIEYTRENLEATEPMAAVLGKVLDYVQNPTPEKIGPTTTATLVLHRSRSTGYVTRRRRLLRIE